MFWHSYYFADRTAAKDFVELIDGTDEVKSVSFDCNPDGSVRVMIKCMVDDLWLFDRAAGCDAPSMGEANPCVEEN